MSITTTTIAIGKWENRETLDYKPCNSVLTNGKTYDGRGRQVQKYPENYTERRPYKIEEAGAVAYVMYDDDTEKDVPIFRIQQEEV